MQKVEGVVFHSRTTTNFHIYESPDGSMISYVKRDRLTTVPPDALVSTLRTPTEADLNDPV